MANVLHTYNFSVLLCDKVNLFIQGDKLEFKSFVQSEIYWDYSQGPADFY